MFSSWTRNHTLVLLFGILLTVSVYYVINANMLQDIRDEIETKRGDVRELGYDDEGLEIEVDDVMVERALTEARLMIDDQVESEDNYTLTNEGRAYTLTVNDALIENIDMLIRELSYVDYLVVTSINLDQNNNQYIINFEF